jgi:WS/DGAT/MGAT family acyltransferase
MRQLTSLDAQFLAVESPSTYGHVSGLAILDPCNAPGGHLRITDIAQLVSERIHLLPPFTCRLADVPFGLDLPYWIEDPDFDLDFHVREIALAPPGDDRQLAEQVSRIVARPLDRSRPLWELYLIHGLAGGRVATLTKIHHAVVDGVSGAEILGILLDASPEGRDVEPAAGARVGERAPSQLEMLGRGLLGIPRTPVRMVRALPAAMQLTSMPMVRGLQGIGTLAAAVDRVTNQLLGIRRGSADGAVLEAPAVRAPRTRFNGRISPHRRFAYGSVSLDKVKAIKNAAGVTLNDAVIALCASALRAWMLERGELPDEPLVAMVPVSVRKPDQMGTFGNRVSMMFVPIPTDEPDPQRRLERAHEVMKIAKDQHGAMPADVLQDAGQFIPPALMARANRVTTQLATGRMRPALNLVISNVPGPRYPLYMAGARLVANYPVSVIIDGVGLNITCLSYLDSVDFGIVVDREQVDDAWPMMEAMVEALDEMERVICGPTPATPTPPPSEPAPLKPAQAAR